MKKTLVYVKALDHFSTNDSKIRRCIIYHSGELVGEDEEYLRIRSGHYEFEPDDKPEDNRVDLHCVIKANIIHIKRVELEWDENDEED